MKYLGPEQGSSGGAVKYPGSEQGSSGGGAVKYLGSEDLLVTTNVIVGAFEIFRASHVIRNY